MSAAPTLAVAAASRLDAGAREFLRICTGLVAGGGSLTLLEVGRGHGLFSRATHAPDDVERQLEALASFGTVPTAVCAAELRKALGAHGRILRVADAGRRGTPELVVVDAAWLMHVPEPALVLAFEEAGQLIRA